MQQSPVARPFADRTPISPAPMPAALFEQLLEHYTYHRLDKGFDEGGAADRVALVRRFSRFADERYDAPWPWQWERYMGESWIGYLRRGDPSADQKKCVVMTLRGYQTAVRMFQDYLLDPLYPWRRLIEQTFGACVIQIFDEFNCVKHYPEEGGAKSADRFPIPRDTVQQIFDYLDDCVERSKGKALLPAARDSVMIKMFYAFGPRNTEMRLIELADFSFNAYVPEYGRIGAVLIRHGKGANGSGPRTRLVRAVPLFEWIVEVLEQYLVDVRPRLPGADKTTALFPSERGSFMSRTHPDDRWADVRRDMGLDERYVLHSFRHSYMTHLLEAGYPAKFVQLQVGHGHLGSMTTYTNHISDEFCNAVLRNAHAAAFAPRTPQRAQHLAARIEADEEVDDDE